MAERSHHTNVRSPEYALLGFLYGRPGHGYNLHQQLLTEFGYCDGKDTNCNGIPDDGCTCNAGYPCYQGPPFTVGASPQAICRTGIWSCATDGGTDSCVGQVLPALVEVCNGLDDDCNGLVDDNSATVPCGPGVCSFTMRGCDAGVDVCNPAVNPPPNYSATEICGDGLDNNCDGLIDEGCTCVLDAGLPCFDGPPSACPADGGACRPICQRGVQSCVQFSDGGEGYGACGGEVLPVTEVCSDSLDNDCDGLVDCADPDCATRSCGNNRTCTGGSCLCVVDGGTPQTTETLCADGRDNDCNGKTDCQDSSCNGLSCGAYGQKCNGIACQCYVDGGTVQTNETICYDGKDNDCDGLIDCQDPTCVGHSCGARNGFQCSGTSCLCSGNGGTAQATETLCHDGRDNDCDGLYDCADPDCASACAETSCSDGIDNDGNGLTDCEDPACQFRPCSAGSPASVCCGAGTNATVCKNLGTDNANCGGCGLTCAGGQTCTPVASGGASSGFCSCATSANCPLAGQNCRLDAGVGFCDCQQNDSACGTAAHCNDITGPDFCSY